MASPGLTPMSCRPVFPAHLATSLARGSLAVHNVAVLPRWSATAAIDLPAVSGTRGGCFGPAGTDTLPGAIPGQFPQHRRGPGADPGCRRSGCVRLAARGHTRGAIGGRLVRLLP